MTQIKPLTLRMVLSYIVSAPEIRRCFFFVSQMVCFAAAQVSMLSKVFAANSPKTLWLGSHFSCVLGLFLYLSTGFPMWYRLSVAGAFSTYVVSVFQHAKILVRESTQTSGKVPLFTILNSENAMLLAATTIHAATPVNAWKLVSFALFLWIHLSSFTIHELLPVNAFTLALVPITAFHEPVLMSAACYADSLVVLVYFYQALRRHTLLVYAVMFAYLSVRRIEHSDLARLSWYNLVQWMHVFAHKSFVPVTVTAYFDSLKDLVDAMVPLQSRHERVLANDVSSVRTRATSFFYERISIIDDLH